MEIGQKFIFIFIFFQYLNNFQDDSDIETASNSLTLDLDPEENTITCVDETNQNSGQDEVQAKVSKDFKMKALHFRAQLLRIDEWQVILII